MRTCEFDGESLGEPRSHPWYGSATDPSARYYDFTATPALIRSSLEDFTPFAHYAAVDQFYGLLERVNEATSPLESSDCAFNGPGPCSSADVKAALECSGRLTLLFRDLPRNTEEERIAWLTAEFHRQLALLDPKFELGVIGTTVVPARYLALPESEQLGTQLLVSFWAYGASDATTMQNLYRLLTNLSRALRSVSARIGHEG